MASHGYHDQVDRVGKYRAESRRYHLVMVKHLGRGSLTILNPVGFICLNFPWCVSMIHAIWTQYVETT